MLSKIKNFFKKENSEKNPEPQTDEEDDFYKDDIDAALIFTISKEGMISIDIDIIDFEEESVKKLANLVSSINTYNFQLEMIHIIRDGFHKVNQKEKFDFFIASILEYSEGKVSDEEPCVSPSDII
jgi:hypothetical protein